MFTELFFPHNFNANKVNFHAKFCCLYTAFFFEIQIIKNGFTGPKIYRVFRETGPRAHQNPRDSAHLAHCFKYYAGRQCNQPMGLQSGRLKNSLVTASSQWDNYHAPYLARLHWKRRGRYMGAWSAKHNNRYQWLQLDFGRAAKIIRLATQGRQDADQWVTQYYVMHSLDGIRFVEYKERNNRRVGEENNKY